MAIAVHSRISSLRPFRLNYIPHPNKFKPRGFPAYVIEGCARRTCGGTATIRDAGVLFLCRSEGRINRLEFVGSQSRLKLRQILKCQGSTHL